MKCKECGAEIKNRGRVTFMEVQSFEGCISNKEKHEEIKQKAWEIYLNIIRFKVCDGEIMLDEVPAHKLAWELAEEFYAFAKKKEGEQDV